MTPVKSLSLRSALVVPETPSSSTFPLFWDLEADSLYLSPMCQPTELPCHSTEGPLTPHPALSPRTRPGSSQAASQGLRWNMPGWPPYRWPLLLRAILPLSAGVSEHTQRRSWSSPLAPHAPGDGLNRLSVTITLPFPIGAILTGPFSGTSVKEKSHLQCGILALALHTLTSGIFSPLPPHPLPLDPFTLPPTSIPGSLAHCLLP